MDLSLDFMERAIRAYFAACNRGDAERIAACFTPDAVHYFPEGGPLRAMRGAAVIGAGWARCVEQLGSYWTVDSFIGDPDTGRAVIEWTHFKRKANTVLRGDEWYRFAPDGRIAEIRAYYACPPQPGVAEHRLGDFDYRGRGYPEAP